MNSVRKCRLCILFPQKKMQQGIRSVYHQLRGKSSSSAAVATAGNRICVHDVLDKWIHLAFTSAVMFTDAAMGPID